MPRCAAERKTRSVDISVQFMGYLAYGTDVRREGCFAKQARKETIVGIAYRSGSVNVLYCIDGNAARYCFKLGSFLCVVVCA